MTGEIKRVTGQINHVTGEIRRVTGQIEGVMGQIGTTTAVEIGSSELPLAMSRASGR